MIDLFPHQEQGASFLAGEKGTAGLFFGMGTGKTITSLEAAARSDAKRLLVIAPPIALPMWQREAEAYLEQPAKILKTGRTPLAGPERVVIVSYAIATARKDDLREWLAKDCSALICDESHALKNPKAKRTKAILGNGGIADGAFYNWQLTGTPITRWNDDMFPFLCRADLDGMKQRCGGTSVEKFHLRYTIRQDREFRFVRNGRQMSVKKKMVIGNRNTEDLANWIYGDELALRVDLEEVFANMPPLTQNRYEIKIDADVALKAKLKELEKASLQDIRSKLEAKEPALATIRRELGLAKVKAAAEELAERIESGQNVLVGAWHTEVIDALEQTLSSKGYTTSIIDGRENALSKQTAQDEWNAGNINALICQIAAAGVSLNLQHGGTQIVIVEEDWSPSIMDQFYARLWRYGQEKHVHVDTLTSSTKLDQALGRISATKEREHARFNKVGQEMNDA
jgi:SWI/SNF-related matrix-associated actin-dependent regulator 1 of chromatin subfamily A